MADLAKTIDSEIPSVELVAYPNPATNYISFKGIQPDNVNEKYLEDYTVSFGDEVDDLADLAKTIDSEIPSVELVAYPNPATNYISFKGIQPDNVNEKYLIINTLGQEVAGGHTSELVKGLRVSEWNSGVYFMHVMQQSGESKSLGFIVKR